MRKEAFGIGATVDWIEEPAVAKLVRQFHITYRLCPLVGSIDLIQIKGNPHLRAGRQMGAHPRHGQAMTQQEMMRGIDSRLAIHQAGRMYTDPIAQVSAAP